MDIQTTTDKIAQQQNLDQAKKMKPQEEDWITLNSNTKQCHLDQLYNHSYIKTRKWKSDHQMETQTTSSL